MTRTRISSNDTQFTYFLCVRETILHRARDFPLNILYTRWHNKHRLETANKENL